MRETVYKCGYVECPFYTNHKGTLREHLRREHRKGARK